MVGWLAVGHAQLPKASLSLTLHYHTKQSAHEIKKHPRTSQTAGEILEDKSLYYGLRLVEMAGNRSPRITVKGIGNCSQATVEEIQTPVTHDIHRAYNTTTILVEKETAHQRNRCRHSDTTLAGLEKYKWGR